MILPEMKNFLFIVCAAIFVWNVNSDSIPFRFNLFIDDNHVVTSSYDKNENKIYHKFADFYNMRHLTPLGQSFVSSTTEGILRYISNGILVKILEKRSNNYQKCVDEYNAGAQIGHPLLLYIRNCSAFPSYKFELYFLLIDYSNCELFDIADAAFMDSGNGRLTLYISSLLVESQYSYNYGITTIRNSTLSFDEFINNQKELWFVILKEYQSPLQYVIMVEKSKI